MSVALQPPAVQLGTVINALEIVTSVTVVRPDGTHELQTWSLNHFSRYILASG